MKREKEEELRSQRGSMSIGFFNISNMSATMSLIYVAAIIGFFGLIFYVLITKLMAKPVDF
jgi:hypothetical protein